MSTYTRKAAVSLFTLGLAALGGVLVQPTAASAATCYSGAKEWSSDDFVEKVGTYTTSSRCQDINLYSPGEGIEACVVFIEHTKACNRITQVPKDKWTVIASDVRDGTRFELHVFYYEAGERSGSVAF